MARDEDPGVSRLAFDGGPRGSAGVQEAEAAAPRASAPPAAVARGRPVTINNIQLLRAIAASGVVAFHAVHGADHYGYEVGALLSASEWGARGVDLFFVISGFVMVYTQTLNPRPSMAFLAQRVRRIVPLYWSLTALWLTFVYFVPSLFRDNSIDLSYWLSSFLFLSLYAENSWPVLDQGWTLEFEMLFYGIFGAAILFSRANNALIACLVLFGLMAFEITNGVAMEFIIGMLIGQAYLYFRGESQRNVSFPFFIIVGIMIPFVMFHSYQAQVVFWGIPAALIVLGSCYVPQVGNRLVLLLGAASYSIYLVQAMSIPLFFKVSRALQLPESLGVELAVAGLVFTILVGTVLHLLYEKPVDNWLHRSFFAGR